jgi:hypothetical protein
VIFYETTVQVKLSKYYFPWILAYISCPPKALFSKEQMVVVVVAVAVVVAVLVVVVVVVVLVLVVVVVVLVVVSYLALKITLCMFNVAV